MTPSTPGRRWAVVLLAAAAALLMVVGWQVWQSRDPAEPRGPAAGQAPLTPGPLTTVEDVSSRVRADKLKGERWTEDRLSFSYEVDVARELDTGTEFLGVRISGNSRDGRGYQLRAERARASPDWQFVRVEGDVTVERDDGAQLAAGFIEHFEREKTKVAGGGVYAWQGGRRVRCDRIEYAAPSEKYTLSGEVVLFDGSGSQSTTLSGQRLFYDDAAGNLLLWGDTAVVSGRTSVYARDLEVIFLERQPYRATFRQKDREGVWLEWRRAHDGCEAEDPDRAELIVGRTNGLDVRFEAGSARSLELYPSGTPIFLQAVGADGPVWTLSARDVRLELTDAGDLQSIRAEKVEWGSAAMAASGQPEQWLRTPVAVATFSRAGALEHCDFPRGLVVVHGAERLTTDHGFTDGTTLFADLRPVLVGARGRLQADRVEIPLAGGGVVAKGQVRSESEASIPGLLAGEGKLHARAEEMEVTAAEDVVYRRGARLWRGADVLSATTIRADKGFARVEAEESVRLLVASRPQRELNVEAARFEYDGKTATWTGEVRLRSGDLLVRADRVDGQLDPASSEIRTVQARGAVTAERPGYTATAAELVHDAATARTTLLGGDEPARVVSLSGDETRGEPLVLWNEGQRIRVGSPEGVGLPGGAAYTRVRPSKEPRAAVSATQRSKEARP